MLVKTHKEASVKTKLMAYIIVKCFSDLWTYLVFNNNTYAACVSCQMNVIEAGGGRCICELTVGEEHQNRNGTLHGGMTATLVDVVSTAALMSNDNTGPGVSVNMNVSLVFIFVHIVNCNCVSSSYS